LALGTLVVWERRWSELRRWELYAGLALQGLIIGPWVLAVARTGHGAEALRALFWNNVVGRFTQVAAPAALDYTSGHRNTAGKYLLELPLYLLPWTFAVAAALCRAWNRVREAAPSATAWRFAIAASLPLLALLSVAAPARAIYAAPALLARASRSRASIRTRRPSRCSTTASTQASASSPATRRRHAAPWTAGSAPTVAKRGCWSSCPVTRPARSRAGSSACTRMTPTATASRGVLRHPA